MNDLVRAGDWVDYKGEKYFLTKIGDHNEHVIVRNGDLKVVAASDLKKWEDKQPAEEN